MGSDLHMQQIASMVVASSGGWQLGKNGFSTYTLKVNATMACEHGLTIMHSIQSRTKAMNGPKVSIM